jgi:hypothetical protein
MFCIYCGNKRPANKFSCPTCDAPSPLVGVSLRKWLSQRGIYHTERDIKSRLSFDDARLASASTKNVKELPQKSAAWLNSLQSSSRQRPLFPQYRWEDGPADDLKTPLSPRRVASRPTYLPKAKTKQYPPMSGPYALDSSQPIIPIQRVPRKQLPENQFFEISLLEKQPVEVQPLENPFFEIQSSENPFFEIQPPENPFFEIQSSENPFFEIQSPKKQPVEMQPSKKQPSEKQPVEMQPSKKQPSEKQLVEKQSLKKQPSEKQLVEKQSSKKQPSEKQLVEVQSSKKQLSKKQSTIKSLQEGYTSIRNMVRIPSFYKGARTRPTVPRQYIIGGFISIVLALFLLAECIGYFSNVNEIGDWIEHFMNI